MSSAWISLEHWEYLRNTGPWLMQKAIKKWSPNRGADSEGGPLTNKIIEEVGPTWLKPMLALLPRSLSPLGPIGPTTRARRAAAALLSLTRATRASVPAQPLVIAARDTWQLMVTETSHVLRTATMNEVGDRRLELVPRSEVVPIIWVVAVYGFYPRGTN